MPAAALKSRDPYFDNARAVLIVLVVIGHVIEMSSSGAARGLYTWIYAFHMPAFILVSGYLARNFTASAKQCGRLLASVLVPYLIFDVLHSLVGAAVNGKAPQFSLGIPAFTLWFLFALVVWRLMVPLLKVLRRPVLVAVAVSLVAGLGTGTGSAVLDRTLGFLPFFALGILLTPEGIERFKAATRGALPRIAAVLVLIGTLGAALLIRDTLPRSALYMKWGYVAVFDSNIEGLLWRAGILAVALLITVALLVLVPAGQTAFTWLGEVTLYVYLLHGLLISPLRPTIASWDLRWPQVAALVAGAVLLTLLLGSRPVRLATRWLIEPRVTWLLRADGPAAAQPATSHSADPSAATPHHGFATPGAAPFVPADRAAGPADGARLPHAGQGTDQTVGQR